MRAVIVELHSEEGLMSTCPARVTIFCTSGLQGRPATVLIEQTIDMFAILVRRPTVGVVSTSN